MSQPTETSTTAAPAISNPADCRRVVRSLRKTRAMTTESPRRPNVFRVRTRTSEAYPGTTRNICARETDRAVGARHRWPSRAHVGPEWRRWGRVL